MKRAGIQQLNSRGKSESAFGFGLGSTQQQTSRPHHRLKRAVSQVIEALEQRVLLTTSMLTPAAITGGSSVTLNSEVYFINSGQVWETDGTTAGTAPISNISSPQLNPLNVSVHDQVNDPSSLHDVPDQFPSVPQVLAPANLTVYNNTVYFTAADSTHGAQLWAIIGGHAQMVSDINAPTYSNGQQVQQNYYSNGFRRHNRQRQRGLYRRRSGR